MSNSLFQEKFKKPSLAQSSRDNICEKVKCTIEAEDTAYKLKKGGVVFIDADIFHRIIIKGDELCRYSM